MSQQRELTPEEKEKLNECWKKLKEAERNIWEARESIAGLGGIFHKIRHVVDDLKEGMEKINAFNPIT